MKRTLTLSTLLLSVCSSIAQITITQADMPSINTTVITGQDTLYTGGTGTSGTSQTWNFASITPDVMDTALFVSPAGQPGASNFPTANLCIANPLDSSWVYLTKNANELLVNGVYGADQNFGTIAYIYNPPFKLISLPSTYMTAFSNVARLSLKFPYPQPPADSLWIKMDINQNSIMDGWGNVTTPAGTYPAIRQKSTEITTDSSFARISGTWTFMATNKDTSISYRWWANNKYFPVLEMETDAAGTVTSGVTYLISGVVGIKENQSGGLAIISYPNPSSGDIHFILPNDSGARIEFYDSFGKMVGSSTISSTQFTFDASVLSAGNYFFRYISSDGSKLLNGKFNVVR